MYIEYYASDGSLMCLGDVNELCHYNHNHDALGRFAKSAGASISKAGNASYGKQYKKQLNKMDKLSTKARGRAMESEYKAKMGNPRNREKNITKAKEYRKISKNADNQAKKLVQKALNDHYDVSMQDVYRNSKKRKDVAVSVVAGLAYAPIITIPAYNLGARAYTNKKYGNYYNGENPRRVSGKKYKVTPSRNSGKKGNLYR